MNKNKQIRIFVISSIFILLFVSFQPVIISSTNLNYNKPNTIKTVTIDKKQEIISEEKDMSNSGNSKPQSHGTQKQESLTAESNNQNLDFSTSITCPVLKDTFIAEGMPDTNYGEESLLKVQGSSGYDSYDKDILIQFDFSSIPADASISSANMFLFYDSYFGVNPAGRTLLLGAIAEDWNENVVTWNIFQSYNNAFFMNPPPSSIVPSEPENWMIWDMTGPVQDLVNYGDEYHNGWLITDPSCDSQIRFRSKEYDENMPYLEVIYEVEEPEGIILNYPTDGQVGIELNPELNVSINCDSVDYPLNVTFMKKYAEIDTSINIINSDVDGIIDVETAYIDNDEYIDLVTASYRNNEISWWKNDGSTGFTKYVIDNCFHGAFDVVAADVDNDQLIDIVAAAVEDNEISWWKNNGDDSFDKHIITISANGPTSLIATDFDNDHDVDIISTEYFENNITCWVNDGTPSEDFWDDYSILHYNGRPYDICAEDIDNDDLIDIVFTCHNWSEIRWLKNDEDQNFLNYLIAVDVPYADSITCIDFNDENGVDVLATSEFNNSIIWWENIGNPPNNMWIRHNISDTTYGAKDLCVVDIDMDDDYDVVSAAFSEDSVILWECDGNPSGDGWIKHVLKDDFDDSRAVSVSDIDNDGDIDIFGAAFDDDTLAWWENKQAIGICHDVYLGDDATTEWSNLDWETMYHWKVFANDRIGNVEQSQIWEFTTRDNSNLPPGEPYDPHPQDGNDSAFLDVDLFWRCDDPDNDDLTYDVYFGTDIHPMSQSPKSEGQDSTSFDVGILESEETYYWQIVANDSFETNISYIWSFTTGDGYNTAPTQPNIPSGRIRGSTGRPYSYSTESSDPDGDFLFYNFSWGDGTYSDWIGPFESGEPASASHIWTHSGQYNIYVTAKDVNGGLSEPSDTLQVDIMYVLDEFHGFYESSLPDLCGVEDGFYIVDHLDDGYYNPLYPNESINVTFTIENRGHDDVDTFPVFFYLSNNSIFDSDDYRLGMNVINDLGMGEIIEVTTDETTIPLDGRPPMQLPDFGDSFWIDNAFYYIGMSIDPFDVIEELNEDNNKNTEIGKDFVKIYIENITSRDNKKVDLDIDSDNTVGTEIPQRDAFEEAIEIEVNPEQYQFGKYVQENNDFDNGTRMLDKFINGIIEEEDDLVPAIIELRLTNSYNIQGYNAQEYPEGEGPGKGDGDDGRPDGDPNYDFYYGFKYLSFKFSTTSYLPSWPSHVSIWRSPCRGDSDSDAKIIASESYQHQVWQLGDLNHNGQLDDEDEFLFNGALNNPNNIMQYWNVTYYEPSFTYIDVCDLNFDNNVDEHDFDLFNQSRENDIARYVPIRVWIEGIKSNPSVGIKVQVDVNENSGYEVNETDIIRVKVTSYDRPRQAYGVPKGYNGTDPDPQLRPWKYEFYGEDPGGDIDANQYYNQPSGFPMNLPMGVGPSPPDFPPLSTDSVSSTSPLVSKAVSYFQGQSPYAERATHNGIIDMMTGLPLIQETDFELPFGGAVFRSIRSYSELSHDPIAQRGVAGIPGVAGIYNGPALDDARSAYYDWTGLRWMTSFNPILLIDAGYAELGNYDSSDNTSRYCYFMEDAYHTVPFEYSEAYNGQYISPDWFDGILLHNGNETTQPTNFWLWANQNSIKYTFNVSYDGVELQPVYDSDDWIDAHDLLPQDEDGDEDIPDEFGEGWGFPDYAFVSKIEDAYGNTVEYEYFEDFKQWECDDPTTPEKTEICQNTHKKGQLRSIKLKNSTGAVIWTLLFVHRAFSAKYEEDTLWFMENFIPRYKNEVYNPTMIHAIYVYEGDIDISEYEDLTLGSELFTSLTSFDEYDLINAKDILDLPDGWLYETRYMYEEADPHYYTEAPENTSYLNYSKVEDPHYLSWDEWNQAGFNLLKTSVTKKYTQPDGSIFNESSNTIYRYEHFHRYRYIQPQANGRSYLEAIFSDSTINNIVKAKEEELGREVTENIIFELKDDNVTILDDPETEENDTKRLLDVADLSMSIWDREDAMMCSDSIFKYDDTEPGEFDEHNSLFVNLSQFISVEEVVNTLINTVGRKTLVDNRANNNNNGKFTYYLLKSYPEYQGGGPQAASVGNTVHTEYHYPYRFQNESNGNELDVIPWDKPFYNFIIDEHDPDSEEDLDPLGLGYDPLDEDNDGETGMLSRRVVQINPRGWVLSDRTWVAENGTLVLNNRSGLFEEREYDSFGRVIELRTYGWTSEENQQDDRYLTNGLVLKYNYSENHEIWFCSKDCQICNKFIVPGKLRAVSSQFGTDPGQIPYIMKYWNRSVIVDYDEDGDGTNRSELYNEYVEFQDPVPLYDIINESSWEVNEDNILQYGDKTEYEYDFKHVNCNEIDAPILNKTVILPAIKPSLDEDPVRSIQKTIADNNGNILRREYGNIDGNGNPVEDFFVDVYEYDCYGRPINETIDAYVPERKSDAPLLNLSTQHEYDQLWGEIWTKYPDGSEKFIVYNNTRENGRSYIDQWMYGTVIWHGDYWEVLGPVTITRLDNYKPIKKMEVTLNDQYHPGVPSAGESYAIISNITVEYDSSGRPISGTREYDDTSEGETEDTQSLTSFVSYHATGQTERSKKPDGTITRQTYDGLGRLEHKYLGSTDIQPVWRNVDPWDSSEWNDDMVQIEKRYYGAGTNDAGKLTTIRHFMNTTANQYNLIAPDDDPQIPENDEDRIGWTTEYEYDGRMHQVVERENSIIGSPIKHQVTWYDNLGRTRLVAVYGEEIGVPSHVDPRFLNAGWTFTSENISDILNTSKAINGVLPLSLSETIYNSRGTSQEMRTYDVFSGDSANYVSSTTFYDHNGNAVESWSQSSMEKSVYNAKGQLINSSTYANTSTGYVEITKTENVYDDVGRVIKVIQWERVHDAAISELSLDVDNSVKTYLYTWYDEAGRVNYTANYGTNSSSNMYITGDEPPYNSDGPVYYDGVLITRNGYDKTGKQNATFNPDGTVTRTEFDKLGRQVLIIENADDPDISLRRYTAYHYDDAGRLDKIAAVLPDHIVYDDIPGVANWSDIDWSAVDGLLQITETLYDADVVETGDLDMSVLSFDGINDFVDTVDDPLDMDDTDDFTISAWIKTNDVDMTIVSKLDGDGGYELGIDESGKLLLQVRSNSYTINSIVGTKILNDSQWHHVVGTNNNSVDSLQQGLRVYVDGAEDAINEGTTIVGSNSDNLKIGRRASENNYYFNGTINEVRIYDRSLSIQEVFILYHGTHLPSGLVGYWKMNESNGDIVEDSSGNGNDGDIYGATWLRVDKRPIFNHGGWISEVRYPDKTTGQPSMDDTLKFTYYMDGSIASRKDSKGNTFYYTYDESGQLSETIIDDTHYYDPDGTGEPSWAPQNRVKKIRYTYEADGQISSVTTYDSTDAIISQNNFSYGGMRKPTEEWQAHMNSVDINTPSIQYEWELSSAYDGDNYNRLQKIIYPNSQREISFSYDGADGLDNALSRISSISVTDFGTVSEYEYAGLSTRISTTLGNGIVTQSFADSSGTGYSGFNQFGQIIDLDYQDGIGDSIHRYQYGYDAAGNREYSRVTQQPYGLFSHINDRSYLYEYDGLHRLINASRGELSDDNSSICPTPQVPAINTSWKLDNLGNWNNGSIADGSMIREQHRTDGTSIPISSIHHETNNANQIVQIYDQGSLVSDVVYGCAGNLVFDGDYFYQYDGFNRLVQINESGNIHSFDGEGRINLSDDPSQKPGDLITSYVYDALGRLIQKEKYGQVVDYYYDGVRRIQEVIDDVVDREYLYGIGYVDEFIGQIDENGDMYHMLQDANYNVMALLNSDGDVLQQYQYDPYGTITCLDIFPGGESLVNCVGHQGLFFENFEGDGLAEDVDGLYYNRNRWYSPTLGRFLSRDPNEAAMPIFTALSMNGDIMQIMAHAYSLQGQYGDGMNLYQYCGSNPVNNADPSGLRSLPYFIIKMIEYLEECFDIDILPPGIVWLSDFISTSIKIFKYWRSIGYDKILYSKVINALSIAIQALRTGLTAFINAMINVGRIAGPYVLQALRVMGSAGASVLNFLLNVAIAAAPYMAVIGIFVLAGYAGYKLGEWLSSVIDRLGEQLWEFLYSTSQSIAKSIVAPVMKAAANYASQLDLVMYELETGIDVSPYV